jgi:hypothetical protein
MLLAFVSALPKDHDSRGQVASVESAYAQFHSAVFEAMIIPSDVPNAEEQQNLPYDWNTGKIRLFFDDANAARGLKVREKPALLLVNPAGKIVWRHDGFTTPAELGLMLRSFLGNPDYAQMNSNP